MTSDRKTSHVRFNGTLWRLEKRLRLIESLGKPLLCHFCGREITKLDGQDTDSLVVHSVDGNHDNWDHSNKTPAHQCCHVTYHNIERRAKFQDRSPPPLNVAMFFVEYDLPRGNRRRGFYRAVNRYRRDHFMEKTGWSTQSVVITESKEFAYLVYKEALKVGGKAHIWRATRIEEARP